jgi:hypothetical protein
MSSTVIKKFTIGSQYFFSCYPDFESKDLDELELVDTTNFQFMRQLTGCGKCLFQLRRQSNIDDYINYALSDVAMAVGKFLIPEFCEAIGFKFEDLPRLQPLINCLDPKHKYEQLIFESYLTNGSFSLTEDQRLKAYKSYKEARNLN